MSYFCYLKYALSGILSFIGIKMCVNEFTSSCGYDFQISNIASLGVIVVLIAISIVASMAVMKNKEEEEDEEEIGQDGQ